MARTPTCPDCGTKFPGDPCKKCKKGAAEAASDKAVRMPRATKRRVKHSRIGVKLNSDKKFSRAMYKKAARAKKAS